MGHDDDDADPVAGLSDDRWQVDWTDAERSLWPNQIDAEQTEWRSTIFDAPGTDAVRPLG